MTSDEGRTVKMEVELRQLPATFTGAATHSSSLVSSGTRARTGTATGMAAGNWGWKYRIVDSIGVATAWQPAGNPDFIVQATATPTISSVSPAQPVATGAAQPFTITGANFITTATVDLEDVTTSEQFYNRTVSSRSGSTGITINPNFGTATVNHSWRVRVNNGATSSSWFNFTVVPPTVTSTISSVSPAQPVAIGAAQPFTITGADFIATATVDLEDVTTSEQFYNRTVSSRSGSTGITINPNFGTATVNHSWRVRVNNGSTPSAWFNFTVVPPTVTPTISSVSPAQPVATGAGQSFTISGADFIATATVDLEDVTTSEQFYNRTVSSRSGSTGITINPNFGTATVNHSWRVRVNNGATSSSWFNFTVVPPTVTPTISSVSPAQPMATGAAQPFTITGADFITTATVDLEDVTTSEQFYNRTVSSRSGSTGITINPNFGTATVNHSWRVRINNGATSSSWFNFTVVPPTVIDPPVSDGFDYPIGTRIRYTEANDGDGWYVAQEFNEFNSSAGKYHLGEDWNAETGGDTDLGLPVYAIANGTIVFAGPATISGWGNVLVIRHKLSDGSLVESLYGHVASFLKTSGSVSRGEQVATIGKPPATVDNPNPPAHLHLELRYSSCPYWGSEGYGYSSTPSPTGWTDPSDFIDAHRPSLSTAYSITPNPATVNENAGAVIFTVTRSGSLPAETISASTTQTEGYSNGSDYTGIVNQSVSFTAGQTTRTVTVTINDDATAESSETFGFIIQRFATDPATTYLAKSIFTITDNDGGGTTKPLGVDVSKYNGTVNWNLVRNAGGKTFAFVRATAGKNTTDEFFAQNIVNARNAGLLVGAYHFAYPEYFTAHEEAQKFLSVAGAYIGAGYLPPVLDIEDSGSENSYPYRMGAAALSQWIRDWCSEVETATGVSGRKVILYTFRWYPRNNYFQSDLNQHPFWVATYPTNPDTDPGNIVPWSTWTFQQYRTDPATQQTPADQGGTCPGITGGTGYADLDSFNGSLAALNALAGNGGGGGSSPVINSPKLTGTTFTLSVPTEVGFGYVLEFKNSPNDASWTPVQTNSGNGGTVGLTNNGATGPSRIYRVRVQ